ncbi:SWIM zinc finger family protein [Streptomyces sp. CA-250714]|uniref:SWIM zinc finger family protein n=1 Tax=Streptomyces sp. CA-250714 TaxID=3240060 RepID=UPI003D91375C
MSGGQAPGRAPEGETESWGGAWLRAMEGTARDPARLERGRAYADQGRSARAGAGSGGGGVSAVRVGPGRITAYVHGSRPRPYRAVWRLPVLPEEEWDAFLAAVAARPVEAAALLDGEIPRSVAATARSAGVRLLPDAGELIPGCSCPDQGHPCKHAAALGYETVRLLDADPWALLLVRGMDAETVREEVARRSAVWRADAGAPGASAPGDEGDAPALPAARRSSPAQDLSRSSSRDPSRSSPAQAPSRSPAAQRQLSSTLPAREVFASAVRPPLPEPMPLPEDPGGPGTFPDLPGAPSADALTFLATDAATRARHALTAVLDEGDGKEGDEDCGDPLPELSLWHDTIRLAATHPQLTGRRSLSSLFAALARSAGRDALELARAAAAWRQGGPAGLDVLETVWDPPAGAFDRGRSALAGLGIAMTIHRNHLTHTTRPVQLRYGRDGRWYPYRAATDGPSPGAESTRDWWPEGPSAPDPVQALSRGGRAQ